MIYNSRQCSDVYGLMIYRNERNAQEIKKKKECVFVN